MDAFATIEFAASVDSFAADRLCPAAAFSSWGSDVDASDGAPRDEERTDGNYAVSFCVTSHILHSYMISVRPPSYITPYPLRRFASRHPNPMHPPPHLIPSPPIYPPTHLPLSLSLCPSGFHHPCPARRVPHSFLPISPTLTLTLPPPHLISICCSLVIGLPIVAVASEYRNLGGPLCRYVGAAGDADGRHRHDRRT
ncbi:hypothetical protein B0H14DRAFT_3896971 [Mycena olivaceomarginata]|nr:hypothetical protein B0H14DRAFT_3896971 [Mycena olivaceomarginata]